MYVHVITLFVKLSTVVFKNQSKKKRNELVMKI
jgi:hypothetical protein